MKSVLFQLSGSKVVEVEEKQEGNKGEESKKKSGNGREGERQGWGRRRGGG